MLTPSLLYLSHSLFIFPETCHYRTHGFIANTVILACSCFVPVDVARAQHCASESGQQLTIHFDPGAQPTDICIPLLLAYSGHN